MQTHKILVPAIKVYAYHGCLPEESRIGSEYEVDVEVTTDFTEAAETDDLSKTVDYVWLAEVVKEEMAIRAKLIELVAQRIVKRYLADEKVLTCKVRVSKLNPPINADAPKVSVEIEG
jgi:dihydroneopterin aldolase